MKKRMVNESKLGYEYISEVISSCEQNGVECIVDDKNGDIYYYDPKRRKYGDDRLLHDNDISIWDIVEDKKLFDAIMFDASGAIFKDFAVKWNGLQKKEDGDDVFKTKKCEMIRMDLNNESLDDDNRDWSASEGEVEIQWMIDDTELGIESGSTETVVIDLDLVDCFEELVYQVTNALEREYGMPFDYDDEWILVDEVELIKRFGCSMSESGSNGGTIDVTLKFTHGHYGKKLKSGDEKTIKLDTSTAPTIYDQDDMLTWIADVASDQIPGGGKVTKYDFETIDPPDDVLIRAVLGDEGFGPDVDVDFEDFEPEDVPSEISYKDALKFYRKMHDAYDERKLNYTKYDKIRNKLMDAIVKGLLKEKSLDELADEWFINYGTMNGWGWKTSFKYNVACALHKLHKAKHPDEHVVDREDTIRGWHSEKCSCGLASSSDSSD